MTNQQALDALEWIRHEVITDSNNHDATERRFETIRAALQQPERVDGLEEAVAKVDAYDLSKVYRRILIESYADMFLEAARRYLALTNQAGG